MRNVICFLSFACAAVAWADPSATVTRLERNDQTGLVIIDYTIADGPAIVTADILTNGDSVGRRLCRTMMGDVNRLVTNAVGRIYWIPRPEEEGFSVEAGKLSVAVRARRPDDPPDYLVVRLDMEKSRRYYESEDDLPHGIDAEEYRRDLLVLRRIPAAGETFTMGASRDEPGCSWSREIGHRVTFTNDFFLGVFEFTYGQSRRYASNISSPQVNPYTRAPLTNVGYEGMLRGWRVHGCKWPQSGHDVQQTDSILFRIMRQRTGLTVDMPTEAQWEFAARAGSTTSLPLGLSVTNSVADDACAAFAWCASNAQASHHPVGLKRPNAWGLYDVLGNVSEMCLDVWSDDNTVYGEIDPPGCQTEERTSHVLRGGGFQSESGKTRLGYRESRSFAGSAGNAVGFRIWCPMPDESGAHE